MNKFNLNLHSVLLDLDKWESSGLLERPILNLTDLPEVKAEVIRPTQEKLENLRRPLNKLEQKVQDAMSDFDTEYYNFANKVGILI